LIRVRYIGPERANVRNQDLGAAAKIAMRRYLSEFRDNFLSRHDGLMAVARRARKMVSR
jgi:hypothetical protein